MMGAGYPRAQVVADHDLGHAPTCIECVNGGQPEMRTSLGGDGFCVEVVRGPEHRHEELGEKGHFPAASVMDRVPLSGEIDEELLAGLVLLAHDEIERALEAPVVVAELAVGVALERHDSIADALVDSGFRPGLSSGVDRLQCGWHSGVPCLFCV